MKRLLAGIATWLVAAGAAHAQSDEALVTRLAGSASYAAPQGTKAPVVALMKLRAGDRVELASGGSLELVYLRSGRREAWTGKAELEVGAEASRALDGTPQVAQLPPAAPRGAELARVRDFASVARVGGVRLRSAKPAPRSGDSFEAVAAARRTYDEWRAQAPADDILPEVYYFSVLDEFRLVDEMQALAAAAARRAPDSPIAKAMAERAAAAAR